MQLREKSANRIQRGKREVYVAIYIASGDARAEEEGKNREVKWFIWLVYGRTLALWPDGIFSPRFSLVHGSLTHSSVRRYTFGPFTLH